MSDLEAILMGFALSVASTVVLLRALEERKQVKGDDRAHGHGLADRRGSGDRPRPGHPAAADDPAGQTR
jgi:hypothetical protein